MSSGTSPENAKGRLARRRQRGVERRRRVRSELGEPQDGVVSMKQLRELGITYEEVRAEVAAGRWHKVGLRTVSTDGSEPRSETARWRWAVWEVGGDACLDGVSALLAWGLQKWDEQTIHVTVPQSRRHRKVDGVRVHVLRDRGHVVTAGLPRTRPEVAALRAAMWARSDRAAATLLAMAAQQRIVDPARLLQEWEQVGRCPRRAVLARLVPLVADGAQALSELDFAELGRARGWPEPDRQVVVHGPHGRVYLDVRFTAPGVVCEINGVQHYQALATIDDALRRNEHAIGDRTALEIPAVALVLDPEPLLDQVEAALRKGGWTRPDDEPTGKDTSTGKDTDTDTRTDQDKVA